MARVKRARKAAGGEPDRSNQRKVTMWLDRDLAKKLRHQAVEDETEIGKVAEPGIRLALGSSHWTERPRPAGGPARPAIAAGTEPEPPAAAAGPDTLSA